MTIGDGVDVDIAQATAQHFFRPAVQQTMNAGAFRAVQQAAEQLLVFAQRAVLIHAAGVLDFFLPPGHAIHGGRQAAMRAPQVHHEHAQVGGFMGVVQHRLQGGVGHAAAVPVVLAVDFSRRKTRRQRAAGQCMGWADLAIERIKELQLAGIHPGGAQAQARAMTLVVPGKIAMAAQGVQHRAGVVIAGFGGVGELHFHPTHAHHHIDARRPEIRQPLQHGLGHHRLVIHGAIRAGITGGGAIRAGDVGPEFHHLAQALFRLVGGQHRGIERANRNARHPIRLKAQLVQRLIGADVISAQGAAPLQYQHVFHFRGGGMVGVRLRRGGFFHVYSPDAWVIKQPGRGQVADKGGPAQAARRMGNQHRAPHSAQRAWPGARPGKCGKVAQQCLADFASRC